jgi:hypothetical protein
MQSPQNFDQLPISGGFIQDMVESGVKVFGNFWHGVLLRNFMLRLLQN